jgi:hypothetical protein
MRGRTMNNSNINHQTHVYFPELAQGELFDFKQSISGELTQGRLSINQEAKLLDIVVPIEDSKRKRRRGD